MIYSSILNIFFIITLGFSNGYLTSLSYMYAINLAKNKYKGKAGSSISFFQMLGILLGSIYSMLIINNIINN